MNPILGFLLCLLAVLVLGSFVVVLLSSDPQGATQIIGLLTGPVVALTGTAVGFTLARPSRF